EWEFLGHRAQGPKFSPPPLPRFPVHRDRLHRLLSLDVRDGVTVVTGPPGAGKTVLLTSWAQARPQGAGAWLSLEESDNIQDRFWPLVATALNTDIAGESLAHNMPSKNDGWVNLLLGSIGQNPTRVLIIDDFHLITDRTILRSLERLVERARSHLSLV